MTSTKRLCALLLAAVLLCTLLPQTALFASAATSGTCGDNLQWIIIDGVLHITGTGEMDDYDYSFLSFVPESSAPWFDYRNWITSVVVEEGVTSLGDYALAGCTALKEATLPESLIWIGDDTFEDCTKLTDLWFYGPAPDNKDHSPDVFCMPFFEDLYHDVTFHFIPSRDDWEYPEYCGYKTDWWTPGGAATSGQCGENLFWSYENGILTITGTGPMRHCDEFLSGYDYWPDMTVPEWYPFHDEITEVRLPEGLTTVGDTAFRECTKLQSITLPESVKGIGAYAFYGCTALKEIIIPDAVRFIGISAFQKCRALESAVIGDGVYGIGCDAFCGCWELQTVTFGDRVSWVCYSAFEDCDALTDVYFPGTEAQWNAIEIGYDNDCLLNAAIHFGQTEHEHRYTAEVTPPTCTEKGYTTYTCKCGDSYTADEVAALGHDWDEGRVDPAAVVGMCSYELGTCIIYTCRRCGDFRKETIPAKGCPSKGYTDVGDAEVWYHEAVDFVLDRGLMGSTKTDALTFEPTTSCTRSMIATMLYSLEGKPAVSYQATFPDVRDGQWYTDAVLWAYQTGVVTGCDNGRFGPNDKVTREQMAVILKAYTEKVKGLDTAKTADLTKFADADKATWSKPYLEWAVAEGLLSGKAQDGKTYLDPQGNATRAEVAAILRSFLLNILEAK